MRKLAVKTAAVGLVSAGALGVLRHVTKPPPLPPQIAQHGAFVDKYPTLAHALVYFTELEEDEALQQACGVIAEIADAESDMNPGTMWRISRAIAKAERILEQAVARATRRSTTHRQAMVCDTDAIPSVRASLDAILHNHMMDYHAFAAR